MRVPDGIRFPADLYQRLDDLVARHAEIVPLEISALNSYRLHACLTCLMDGY